MSSKDPDARARDVHTGAHQCGPNPQILFMARGFYDSFGLYVHRARLYLAAKGAHRFLW